MPAGRARPPLMPAVSTTGSTGSAHGERAVATPASNAKNVSNIISTMQSALAAKRYAVRTLAAAVARRVSVRRQFAVPVAEALECRPESALCGFVVEALVEIGREQRFAVDRPALDLSGQWLELRPSGHAKRI